VDLGNYYSNVWSDSVEVANGLGSPAALTGVVNTINAHHSVFTGAPLPDWVSDFAINEMSHFRGLIWTRDGRIREFEANDCPDLDSQHNDHQRHLPYLWLMPQFEQSKMKKWASGQASDGHLPEYLGSFGLGPFDQPGGRTMADTTTIWLLELLELYRHTGDVSMLAELYPTAVGAVKWQIGASKQLGLPYGLVCTYDILDLQQYPTTTFNGFLHLAAMRAGSVLAGLVGDNATAALADAAFERGMAAMTSLLWNTTYNYFRAYTTGDAIMPDCMYGQMLALEHGLGYLVDDPAKLSQQLAAEVKYNQNQYGFTVLTGRSSPPPLKQAARSSPRLARVLDSLLGLGVDTRDDVDWLGAAPTWSFIALWLGEVDVDTALEPTRLTVENFRTRLADWWNLVGITTSGDWGNNNTQNGMPYVTSHYGFLLPDYHLFYALTGQATDIPSGKLSFAPKYPCPYTLPLLLAGTTGTVSCSGTASYSVNIAFGALNLPAGGLSVSGSVYPGKVALTAGQSVSW